MYEIKRDIHTLSHAILVIISWKIFPPLLITIWHAYESWICCCFIFIYTYSISLVRLRYGNLPLPNTELSFRFSMSGSWILYKLFLISYLNLLLTSKQLVFCFSSKISRSMSVTKLALSELCLPLSFSIVSNVPKITNWHSTQVPNMEIENVSPSGGSDFLQWSKIKWYK